ncbi:hypothetical protein [Candidatus Avelusimicrobium sp.]|uniref:hypothetical protein n=1 Tax=Candidatus Avelusimicrobium sp. TaxID=3048833 RepID=UPI003D7E0104
MGKKLFILFLAGLFVPTAAFAQKNPLKSFKGVRKILARTPRVTVPAEDAALQHLVEGTPEHQILARFSSLLPKREALAPLLKDARINSEEISNVLTREVSRALYKMQDQNTNRLSPCMLVLSQRIRSGMKLSHTYLLALEYELRIAQNQAEQEFRKRYQYSAGMKPTDDNPNFRALLGEATAQRLNDHFLPLLPSADRVRFLTILMQGVFSPTVNMHEFYTALLAREVRTGLRDMGGAIGTDEVKYYGQIKETLLYCARVSAEEAAYNSLQSPRQVRELFVGKLEDMAPRLADKPEVRAVWDKFVAYYKHRFDPHTPQK